ncbi:hypothetical protein V8C26DRAFT_395992 [Trichoderma gracile]
MENGKKAPLSLFLSSLAAFFSLFLLVWLVRGFCLSIVAQTVRSSHHEMLRVRVAFLFSTLYYRLSAPVRHVLGQMAMLTSTVIIGAL